MSTNNTQGYSMMRGGILKALCVNNSPAIRGRVTVGAG